MDNDKYNNEEVFVIPFNETNYINNGYTNTNDKNIYTKFDLIGKYVLRSDAEKKIEMQQIIPYIIFKNQFKEYLTIQLLKDNTTSKENITLGICDHIKKEDGYVQPILKRILSILTKDIRINNVKPIKHIGYVRDLKGKFYDHLGIVFIMDCIKSDIYTSNNNFYKYSWMSKNQLIDKYGKLEDWSKYIVDYMVDKI